jgi:hypothetical protein
MPNENYKKILLYLIDKLISKKWSVLEFRSVFYMYVVETIPANALSEEDFEFFCDIQEKLDFTGENPEELERECGYLDYDEYVEWVKNQLEKYLKGEIVTYRKP